jgi:uncharacterized Rmd1/YagE family protein
MTLFAGSKALRASAWFVGERIDVRALDRGDVQARVPLTLRAGEGGLAIVFRYGVVVFFEMQAEEQRAFLDQIAPQVTGAFEERQSEHADLVIDPSGEEHVDADGAVHLRATAVECLQVVAEVLAKSAVLSHYEARVADLLGRVESHAERLKRGTERGFSARALMRDIGDVLTAETYMANRVEVVDKPEITWDRPSLDRLYVRLSDEYELRERDVVLSRKLDLASRSAGTFLDLLQTRRSLNVEWYIVALILVEIVILIYDIWLR